MQDGFSCSPIGKPVKPKNPETAWSLRPLSMLVYVNAVSFLLHPEQQSNEIRRARPSPSTSSPQAESFLPDFQHHAGNQAIQSLFRFGAIRASLAIGRADDPAEQEADTIASQLASAGTPNQASATSVSTGRSAFVGSTSHHVPGIVEQVLHSGGHPLDASTRSNFESRFGADFSQVRVHTGAEAAASARSINARAYTAGSDIAFGAGEYSPDTTSGRSLLAHELVHVAQHSTREPKLRRFPMCSQLLSGNDTGRLVPESDVQEFLADELESKGSAERELRIPGGSAAPWRTEGSPWDDTVIDPQFIDEATKGSVDIALWTGELKLEFMEVKKATWPTAQFAEQQLLNYVAKGNRAIRDVERLWRRRGYPDAHITSVRGMPTSRFTPPQQPTQIDGQQVMLAWCRDGVIVYKPLDVDNEELHYCGISDKGRTDAFIGRLLGKAEEAVVRALRRRLNELFPGSPVNVKLLLDKARARLQESIHWMLEQALNEVCATALEITAAAVLSQLTRWLWNNDLVDGLLWKLTPNGDGIDLPLGEAAARSATVLTVGLLLDALLSLVPAL